MAFYITFLIKKEKNMIFPKNAQFYAPSGSKLHKNHSLNQLSYILGIGLAIPEIAMELVTP